MRIDRTDVELPVPGRHTVDWGSLDYSRDTTGFPLKSHHRVKPAAENVAGPAFCSLVHPFLTDIY